VKYTTVAFSESQDSATLVNIAALADPHVTVSGDDIRVPKGLPFLLGLYFFGPNFTLGQFEAPSLRRVALIDIEPADLAAEPASPAAFHSYFDNPLPLTPGEVTRALGAEDGSGATRITALAFFGDGPAQPHKGEIFTVRVTNGSTLTANAWTNGALTFTQTLPEGRYGICGARFQSAGLQAFRFVFPGVDGIRPGGVGFDSDGDLDVPVFRKGMLGIWGEFESDAPPTADFLSNSADTAQVGHLDLVKLS
jgi:hypothetical protein